MGILVIISNLSIVRIIRFFVIRSKLGQVLPLLSLCTQQPSSYDESDHNEVHNDEESILEKTMTTMSWATERSAVTHNGPHWSIDKASTESLGPSCSSSSAGRVKSRLRD